MDLEEKDVWRAAWEGSGILVGVGPGIGYLVKNTQITRLRQPMKVKPPRIIILEIWKNLKTSLKLCIFFK